MGLSPANPYLTKITFADGTVRHAVIDTLAHVQTLEFPFQAAAPAAKADTIVLYALKDVNGKLQLWAKEPDGTSTKLVQE